MTRILHLAELGHWRTAQSIGAYRHSTRGALLEDVGFIHCSGPDQLQRVAAFIYAGYPGDLVVLELDAQAVAGGEADVRWEDGGDGELFPHLYGILDPKWVGATYRATMHNGVLLAPGLYPAEKVLP